MGCRGFSHQVGFPRYIVCTVIALCFCTLRFGTYFQHSVVAERTRESNPIKVVSVRGLEEEMDDSLGSMFKLTGSNYSVWKSKMRETGQDRCHGLGSNAHEDNNIHSVIHRHEPVQQLQ